MRDCGHENEVGSYVLGATTPTERLVFERHLAGCVDCQEAVRRVAGLPGLLARVPVEIFEGGEESPPVPDTLLPRMLSRARRDRRRRTAVTAGIAAAVVGGVAVLATWLLASAPEASAPEASAPISSTSGTSSAPLALPQRLARVGPDHPAGHGGSLAGWVSMTRVAWGTRLDLTCSYSEAEYADPGSAGTWTLVVTHRDGTVQPLTSWQAHPGSTAKVSAGTAATLSEIREVSVRGSDGVTVLRLRT